MYSLMVFVSNWITIAGYSVEIIAKGLFNDKGSFCQDTWRATDLLYIFCYFLNYWLDLPILDLTQYMSTWLLYSSFPKTLDSIKHVQKIWWHKVSFSSFNGGDFELVISSRNSLVHIRSIKGSYLPSLESISIRVRWGIAKLLLVIQWVSISANRM